MFKLPTWPLDLAEWVIFDLFDFSKAGGDLWAQQRYSRKSRGGHDVCDAQLPPAAPAFTACSTRTAQARAAG
jgi:hypothetical protein